jgi:hypothetical protein
VHDRVEQERVDGVAFARFDDEAIDIGISGREPSEGWIHRHAGQSYEAFGVFGGFDFRSLDLDGVREVEVIDLVALCGRWNGAQ